MPSVAAPGFKNMCPFMCLMEKPHGADCLPSCFRSKLPSNNPWHWGVNLLVSCIECGSWGSPAMHADSCSTRPRGERASQEPAGGHPLSRRPRETTLQRHTTYTEFHTRRHERRVPAAPALLVKGGRRSPQSLGLKAEQDPSPEHHDPKQHDPTSCGAREPGMVWPTL